MPKAIKQTVTPMWLDIKEFYTKNTKTKALLFDKLITWEI